MPDHLIVGYPVKEAVLVEDGNGTYALLVYVSSSFPVGTSDVKVYISDGKTTCSGTPFQNQGTPVFLNPKQGWSYEVYQVSGIPATAVGDHVRLEVRAPAAAAQNAPSAAPPITRFIDCRPPNVVTPPTDGYGSPAITVCSPTLAVPPTANQEPTNFVVSGDVSPSSSTMTAWVLYNTGEGPGTIIGTATTPPVGSDWSFTFNLAANTQYGLYIQGISGDETTTVGPWGLQT